MSNYTKITRHPNTGEYALAKYIDDYFGQHKYGVEFPDDKVVYPIEQVKKAQLKEFWVDDVIEAIRVIGRSAVDTESMPTEAFVLLFLDELQTAYKARWERDPIGGEGAVDHIDGFKASDDRL